MKLETIQEQYIGKRDPIWYGGTLLKGTKGTMEIYIMAIGNIRAELFDEYGNSIELFVDINNTGQFYNTFKKHIKDDSELYELIENGQTGKFPCLVLEEHNWFEVWAKDNKSQMAFADVLEDVDYSQVHFIAEQLMDYYIKIVKEERQ